MFLGMEQRISPTTLTQRAGTIESAATNSDQATLLPRRPIDLIIMGSGFEFRGCTTKENPVFTGQKL